MNESYRQRFMAYVNDDLNTSQAIALIWELVKAQDLSDADKKATLDLFDHVLGLQLAAWKPQAAEPIPEAVVELAQQRAQAREAKDWAAADAARDELAELGYAVKDTPEGFEIVPA